MADTPPTLVSATLNKTAYAKGEQMILTVRGHDPDEEQIEVTVSLRNKASGATSQPVTVTASVDELDVVVGGSREWTPTGRSGDAFTLTSTA